MWLHWAFKKGTSTCPSLNFQNDHCLFWMKTYKNQQGLKILLRTTLDPWLVPSWFFIMLRIGECKPVWNSTIYLMVWDWLHYYMILTFCRSHADPKTGPRKWIPQCAEHQLCMSVDYGQKAATYRQKLLWLATVCIPKEQKADFGRKWHVITLIIISVIE